MKRRQAITGTLAAIAGAMMPWRKGEAKADATVTHSQEYWDEELEAMIEAYMDDRVQREPWRFDHVECP